MIIMWILKVISWKRTGLSVCWTGKSRVFKLIHKRSMDQYFSFKFFNDWYVIGTHWLGTSWCHPCAGYWWNIWDSSNSYRLCSQKQNRPQRTFGHTCWKRSSFSKSCPTKVSQILATQKHTGEVFTFNASHPHKLNVYVLDSIHSISNRFTQILSHVMA